MSDFLSALPDVVAETILWRLPVKSILQCRCVCKSWYYLITSPNFISTHLLRRTLTTKNPQIFLDQKDFCDTAGKFLLLFDHGDYFRSISFHIPIPNPPPSHCIQMVGSVNGLICFSFGATLIVKLILCNPIIGHFKSITPPRSGEEIDWKVKGFGFDERTLDFNILLISDLNLAFIYSLNSNSWRRITCAFPKEYWGMNCNSVIFADGKFHWLVWQNRPKGASYNSIMVFDVKSETLDYLSWPKGLKPATNLSFMKFGESTAIVQYHHKSHIWIMERCGSVESWFNYTIAPRSQLKVLGFRSTDEVVIKCHDGCIASRKIDTHKSKLENRKRIMDVDKSLRLSFRVHNYVANLVLLDKQNNVDVAAPTHTTIDVTAETLGNRTQISDVNETPTVETARRSQRIKHKAAKYT